MRDSRDGVTPMPCPACGHHLDAATGMYGPNTEQFPREGDVSVCLACAEVLIFGAGGRVRLPNVRERLELAEDQRVQYLRHLAATKPWGESV